MCVLSFHDLVAVWHAIRGPPNCVLTGLGRSLAGAWIRDLLAPVRSYAVLGHAGGSGQRGEDLGLGGWVARAWRGAASPGDVSVGADADCARVGRSTGAVRGSREWRSVRGWRREGRRRDCRRP